MFENRVAEPWQIMTAIENGHARSFDDAVKLFFEIT